MVGMMLLLKLMSICFTGNPRWTLKGHTAPPNTIRLDNRGLQCLTFDSLGRDRSVRVWDIHTGKHSSLGSLTFYFNETCSVHHVI